MNITDWFLAELESEAAISRRVLAQVPEGKREWKPHDKSMEFGYLSELVAAMPSWIGFAILRDELDIAPGDGSSVRQPPMNTSAELVAGLDNAVRSASGALRGTTDAHLQTPWRLLAGGQTVMEQPRYQVIRDTLLHASHHRGQLTVYLRLLGAKVPSVYGPSADDRRFA
jgi:uncharacterized damage-inducible protein DinB